MTTDTIVDFQLIVKPILEMCGTIIAAFIAAYVPKAINAFATWANIKMTDQQRAIMLGSIQTAVGKIETKLDQKVLSVSHISIEDPTIRAEARAAIDAVRDTASALGVTEDGAARMIVGKVDTSVRIPVAPTPAAPAIIPAS